MNKSLRNSDSKDPNQKHLCNSKQETVFSVATTVIPQNTKKLSYQNYNNLNIVNNISRTNQDIISTHNNHSIKILHQNIRGLKNKTNEILCHMSRFTTCIMFY